MTLALTTPYPVFDSEVTDVHLDGRRIGSIHQHQSGGQARHVAVCSSGHGWRSDALGSQDAALVALTQHRQEKHA